jgi:hypothetical protein
MKGPTINGKSYELVVLRILQWDNAGRPSKAEIGYDDTEFRLDDESKPNEFLSAFVPSDSIGKPRTNN